MYGVNIFIRTTWEGPLRKDGATMWLIEYRNKRGEPVTREGVIRLEDATENQAVLTAVAEAVERLTKTCSVRVFTGSGHVYGAVKNRWYIRWKKNGWKNAKGKPLANAELWKRMTDALQGHMCAFCRGQNPYREVMRRKLEKEMEEWQRKQMS